MITPSAIAERDRLAQELAEALVYRDKYRNALEMANATNVRRTAERDTMRAERDAARALVHRARVWLVDHVEGCEDFPEIEPLLADMRDLARAGRPGGGG